MGTVNHVRSYTMYTPEGKFGVDAMGGPYEGRVLVVARNRKAAAEVGRQALASKYDKDPDTVEVTALNSIDGVAVET